MYRDPLTAYRPYTYTRLWNTLHVTYALWPTNNYVVVLNNKEEVFVNLRLRLVIGRRANTKFPVVQPGSWHARGIVPTDTSFVFRVGLRGSNSPHNPSFAYN